MTTQKRSYTAPAGTIISDVKLSDDKKTLITIFEQEKYVPKVGDCVELSNGNGRKIIMVYGGLSDCGRHKNKGHYITTSLGIETDTNFGFNKEFCHFKQLTTEEYQSKFNAIGYEYDFETHTASKMKWKPEHGEEYLFIDSTGNITGTTYGEWNVDKGRVNFGNCFKDRDSAEKFLEYIKQYKP